MPITPLQVVGLAKETTYGTFVSATDFLPVTTGDVTTNQKIVRPQRMDGIRGIRRDHRVGIETGFTLSADFYPMGFTKLIAGAFGAGSDTMTGTGTTGYTHTIVPTNTLPSYSVELANDFNSTTQLLSRQVPGCVVDTMTIKGTAQSLLTIDATLFGQLEQTPTTPGKPSFTTTTYPDVEPMDFSQLAVTYGGSSNTNLTDFAVTIQNTVQRVFTANGHLYIQRLVPTTRQVMLTANWDFVDLTQYTDWSTQGAANLKALTFTASGDSIPGTSSVPYSIALSVPRARVDQSFTLANKAEVLEANLQFSVTLGTNANELTATIVNGESTALS
jgi:Phage tail tube protein